MIEARFSGFDDADAALARLPATFNAEARQAMEASLLLVEADYKQNLQPFKLTGRSINSVTYTIEGSGLSLVGQVGPASAWGRAFELGRPPGIWPPLGPLIVWVRARHLSGVYSLKSKVHARITGRGPAAKSFEFFDDLEAARGVQRKIAYRGIPPHPALVPAFEKNLPAITELFKRVGVRVLASIVKGGH